MDDGLTGVGARDTCVSKTHHEVLKTYPVQKNGVTQIVLSTFSTFCLI